MTTTDTLRDLISHRVAFGYENGTTLTGYVSACRPAQGTVSIVALTRVEITDEMGNLLEQHRELVVIPSVLTNHRIAEGPSAHPSRQ